MVHGGGHHHRHSGARASHHHHSSAASHRHQRHHHPQGTSNQWNAWGWWAPQYRYNNPNVIVINNTNRDRGLYPPNRVRRREQQQTDCDECKQCCRACWVGCCTCWLAAGAAQEAPKCGKMSHWIFLSLCFFVLLVIMSGMSETWTFNPGETRRVPKRVILTSNIQIQSQVANGILVYDIDGSCPALTGPIVPLDESMTLRLEPDDYQFDYYFLNKGSSITVSFQQRKGTSNLYLLRGASKLQEIQGDEDYPDFLPQALLTRYAAHCHECPPKAFTYTVFESDTYIVVYDNASSSRGKAHVSIHVDLTTYNLSQQTPNAECRALDCLVETTFSKKCLLLQAPSDGSIVTVYITAKRRWITICILSLVPCMIALLLHRGSRQSQGDDNLTPPPTATNPQAAPFVSPQPTSNVVDYESIPIVSTDDIVAVPVPEKE